MMKGIKTVGDVCRILETAYPLHLQESYDNCGLQVGHRGVEVKGVLLCVDVTEDVVREAKEKGCNMILSHHPLIFRGVKRLTGSNYIERIIESAIKNDIALYACHTCSDNALYGVSYKMAEKLGLSNITPLDPKNESPLKIVTFVPESHSEKVAQAMYDAGAGTIGNYDMCSYRSEGYGTFRATDGCNPYCGTVGEYHKESEVRLEMIVRPSVLSKVIKALTETHPYEEPAYDIIKLDNNITVGGSGAVGEYDEPVEADDFISRVAVSFDMPCVRHTDIRGRRIKKVALCGGSGAEFVSVASRMGADAIVTADVKYHTFFDAIDGPIIVDIGHFESELHTLNMFSDLFQNNCVKFAVLKSTVRTNPINYFINK